MAVRQVLWRWPLMTLSLLHLLAESSKLIILKIVGHFGQRRRAGKRRPSHGSVRRLAGNYGFDVLPLPLLELPIALFVLNVLN